MYNGFYVDWYWYKKRCFLRFILFEKGDKQKIPLGFLRFVSILFLIFEKGDKQKIALGFLRFVSILFLIFEKGDKQKNSARFFKICKYTF